MQPARYPSGIETRGAVAPAVSGRRLEGRAASYGVPAQIGGFTETIRAGAFRATLASNSEVLALVDHDPSKLLARTGSGTLRLTEMQDGLYYSLDVPNTALGNDLLEMVRRGDCGGCSFGFTVPPGGEAWDTNTTRELRAINLAEISIIHAWPAYSQTSVSVRARMLTRAEASARLRLRLLELG